MNEHLFEALFARYSARFQPLGPIVSLGSGGGLSGANLWRFRAEIGELLLRAWPAGTTERTHVDQVHHWLMLTASLGFVPVPLRDQAGNSVQEWAHSLWELTPWLSGSADRACPPPLRRLRLAFHGLAAFHERLAGEQAMTTSAGLNQRREAIIHLIAGGFDRLEAAINCHAQSGSANFNAVSGPLNRETAHIWLTLARTAAPLVLEALDHVSNCVVRVQPVIRDARPEHFLFEDDQLSGLVDFGAMGRESVAADLARLIGEWLDGDLGARREALASYENVRPLDPDEARLIAVFEATTALFIGERWARWHYVENRRFDDPTAVSKGLDRGLIHARRLVHELTNR